MAAQRLFSHDHVCSRGVPVYTDRNEGDSTSGEQGGAIASAGKSGTGMKQVFLFGNDLCLSLGNVCIRDVGRSSLRLEFSV